MHFVNDEIRDEQIPPMDIAKHREQRGKRECESPAGSGQKRSRVLACGRNLPMVAMDHLCRRSADSASGAGATNSNCARGLLIMRRSPYHPKLDPLGIKTGLELAIGGL